MTLSIISFLKYDNAILPLTCSWLDGNEGEVILLNPEIHTKNILARASNANVFFSVFSLI